MNEKTDWDKYIYLKSKTLDVFYQSVIKAYFKLMSNIKEPIKSILELGAGSGKITHELAKKYNIKEITLVDSNKKAIETCKKVFAGRDNVKIIHRDLFDTNYDLGYDLVHSQGLIEHFDSEKQQELVNIHSNLTRKGGYVIIFVPTPTKMYNASRKIAEKTGKWIFTDEVPMTKEQLIEIGRKAGLEYIADAKTKFTFTEAGVLFKKL
ncbi:MAG: class I SAM-dependent methyltransferase [Candidatus Nanoarchaeia archaeon]|nr:class I SAM-dependent methyltransferase [Candidatus Nanoarchaeia archaeon]